MSGAKYLAPVTEADVTKCMDRLLAGDVGVRVEAASELARLGIWARGSALPRGTLTTAARNELPQPERVESLNRLLSDPDPSVRKEVARALGEWSDEESVRAISERLEIEPVEEVLLSYIRALGTIGGPRAVDGLLGELKTDSEAVVEEVVEATQELVTGGRVDDTDLAPRRHVSERPRTEAERALADRIVKSVTEALESVRAETASLSVRSKAEDTLSILARQNATQTYRISSARLEAIMSDLMQTRASAGDHVSEEDLAAYAMETLPEAQVADIDAHLAGCATCASESERMVEAFEPWRGEEGEAALARLRERLLAVSARIAAAPASLVGEKLAGSFRGLADRLSARLRGIAFLGDTLLPAEAQPLLARSEGRTKMTLDLETDDGVFGVFAEERDGDLILRFDTTNPDAEGFIVALEAEGTALGSEPLKPVPGGLGCEITISREQREKIPEDAQLLARLEPADNSRKDKTGAS
jgi:HEAT repeat protein